MLNETRYPQDIRNCDKCHDSLNAATPQASNWKNKPQAEACGACHDGINFRTGLGVTLADAAAGETSSQINGVWAHVAGPQVDNSSCGSANCHSAERIDIVHRPVTPPNASNALRGAQQCGGNTNTNAGSLASNLNRLPAGAIKVSYDVKSVARLADGTLQMKFQLLQNGTAVPLQTFSSAANNAGDRAEGNLGQLHGRAQPVLRLRRAAGRHQQAVGIQRHRVGLPQNAVVLHERRRRPGNLRHRNLPGHAHRTGRERRTTRQSSTRRAPARRPWH